MDKAGMARKVYQVFKDHLANHHFHFEPHDDDLVLTMKVHGEDLPQPTMVRVIEDRGVVQILSPIPSRIPEDKRTDAAIAVAAANYGMINGCFDFDMKDGEIRFRVTQGYMGVDFGDELAGYMLRTAFFTTDKYNDRFYMLGKGMMSLEDFIQKDNE